jgi:CRP-like cAMP-binding protein
MRSILGSEADRMAELGVQKTLSRVPILAGMNENQRKHIFGTMKEVIIKAGEEIIKAADVGTTFYIIVQGNVEVIDVGSGSIVNTMSEGDYFGEGALIAEAKGEENTTSATCRAGATTVTCR